MVDRLIGISALVLQSYGGCALFLQHGELVIADSIMFPPLASLRCFQLSFYHLVMVTIPISM